MAIPLSIFLYIYYAFLVFWGIFSLIGVYHMLKFGMKNFTTFFTTFSYLAVAFILIVLTYNFVAQVGWDNQLPLPVFTSNNRFTY